MGRVFATALRAGVMSGIILFAVPAPDAFAYCRATTCDLTSGVDCKQDSDGCAHAGVDIGWIKMPIVYRFAQPSGKLDEDQSRDAIRAAFKTWHDVQCDGGRTSVQFKELSEIDVSAPSDAKSGADNFAIFFRDDDWPHDDKSEVLAKTNQLFGVDSGNIAHTTIEINTFQQRFTLADDADPSQGDDLQSVITHEIGHYIGLAHSPVADSMMAPSYCSDHARCTTMEKTRALSADDIQGVCDLYPPGPGSTQTTTPLAHGVAQPGCDVTSRGSSPSRAFLLTSSFTVLALAIMRRRRRRSQS